MTVANLDQILEALENARQRATYGAVATLVGRTPRTLMRGRQRDQRHSWVVNRTSGKPTGYADEELHPELASTERIIDSPAELAQWLSSTTTVSHFGPTGMQTA